MPSLFEQLSRNIIRKTPHCCAGMRPPRLLSLRRRDFGEQGTKVSTLQKENESEEHGAVKFQQYAEKTLFVVKRLVVLIYEMFAKLLIHISST